MKFKNPPDYSRRIVKKFLFFPKTLKVYYNQQKSHLQDQSETRWFEVAEIVQEFYHIGGWQDTCWTKQE